jgi:ribosomal protein S18 acetylase RimI-like enzyme
MAGLHIRAAEDSDREALLAMAERLQEGVAPWRDPDEVRRAVVGWVEDSLADRTNSGNTAFVAERDGEIVGFICASERAHFTGQVDTYVGELVVSRSAERQGVGRALVKEVETWGRSRGRARVVVDTGAANAPARRFYAALGFEEEDITVSRAIRLSDDGRAAS